MKFLPCVLLTICALPVVSLHAKTKSASAPAPEGTPSRDDVVRLQIYLDEQNFSPGKIDGRYGGFTAKSWQRFQESRGVNPPVDKFDATTFTSIDPIYATYTVNKDDLGALGVVPKDLALQTKNKVLPYTSMAELLGERYHVGVDFLRQLNAGKNLDQIKEGDKVRVPNVVPPFNLAQVIALRQYTAEREKAIKAAKEAKAADTKKDESTPAASPLEEMPGPTVAVSASPPPPSAVPPVPASGADSPAPSPSPTDAAATADNRPVLRATPANSSRLVFHVETSTSYLEVRDGDRLVACFPITPGSKAIPTPKGEWHVVAKTLLPEFRWDKSVLMTGKRSNTFFQLPPGPNNPGGHLLDRPQQAGHRDAWHGGTGHHRALGQPRVHPAFQLGCVQGVRHGRAEHEGHHRIASCQPP